MKEQRDREGNKSRKTIEEFNRERSAHREEIAKYKKQQQADTEEMRALKKELRKGKKKLQFKMFCLQRRGICLRRLAKQYLIPLLIT